VLSDRELTIRSSSVARPFGMSGASFLATAILMLAVINGISYTLMS
jgi:hypothetical protein